jgi:hypothetical protein
VVECLLKAVPVGKGAGGGIGEGFVAASLGEGILLEIKGLLSR